MNLSELLSVPYVATLCFAFALLHTFSVKAIQHIAHKYPEGSVGENVFHLLGEVEIVFGLWAAVFLVYLALFMGLNHSIEFLEKQNFTEPAFVFVIMSVSSTRPILHVANWLIEFFASLLPVSKPVGFYVTCLTMGPLLGSLITEPAAMTVTALLLLSRLYRAGISNRLKYATLGLLFVNISIGGVLTPFAAPPVLMVAGKWNWDIAFMLQNFGWKAVLAVFTSAVLVTVRFREEIKAIAWSAPKEKSDSVPAWVAISHLAILALIVVSAHHMVVFLGIFMLFLGIYTVTREYQDELKLREALLVSFFLGGLVILGGPQRWWLEPILTSLSSTPLFFGAMTLTAVTDNAALTYLGSQVPTLTEFAKYALVAGSVVGGGLTVVANAPNPAGYGILNSSFGEDGISPLSLLLSALIPTAIAAVFLFPF